jgi:hypothetical protein
VRATRIFLMLVTAVFLAGCIHKFTQESLEQSITKGKTTKQEVLALLGEPVKRYKKGGMTTTLGKKELVLQKPGEVWVYSSHRFRLFDLIEPEPLRIMFDENGIVSYYDYKDEGD